MVRTLGRKGWGVCVSLEKGAQKGFALGPPGREGGGGWAAYTLSNSWMALRNFSCRSQTLLQARLGREACLEAVSVRLRATHKIAELSKSCQHFSEFIIPTELRGWTYSIAAGEVVRLPWSNALGAGVWC